MLLPRSISCSCWSGGKYIKLHWLSLSHVCPSEGETWVARHLQYLDFIPAHLHSTARRAQRDDTLELQSCRYGLDVDAKLETFAICDMMQQTPGAGPQVYRALALSLASGSLVLDAAEVSEHNRGIFAMHSKLLHAMHLQLLVLHGSISDTGSLVDSSSQKAMRTNSCRL